jgi:hypothetical protein
MSEPSTGTLLVGRYRLGSLLGRGGMGTVWRAVDQQLGREVAIKILAPHALARPDAVPRLEREARVGAMLAHPGVVSTLDVGTTPEGTWFVVMQLVPGGDLAAYRERHLRLSVATVIAIGYQLADALAAAHERGVVHRDLKPENVLLDGEHDPPVVRIADFGLAYSVRAEDPRQGKLTVDGTVAGTPEYMSPEQASGGDLGPPSDVYALGCVLFDLLTGSPPFAEGGVGRILAQHLYTPPPRVRDRRPDTSPALDELIDRMLAKRPGDRPTVLAVRKRLAVLDGSEAVTGAHARDAMLASDRAERMVSVVTPATTATPATVPAGELVEVAITGEVPRELIGALRAADLAPVSTDAAPLRLLIGATLEQVALAVAAGAVVVADATRPDFARISDLLRLGVADIVFAPLAPADVVRRLRRAARRLPGGRT